MYLPNINLEIKCAYCQSVLYAESTLGVGWATDDHVMRHLRIKEVKILANGDTLCKDCKAEGVE